MFSCTEKFYPEIDEDVSILVVDGKITNELNSCEVRLFRTVGFTDNYELKPETEALIVLYSDDGLREVLQEKNRGIYHLLNNINAKIGKSYWIEIETNSGEKYESSPETLNPPIEINSIYGEELDEILGEKSRMFMFIIAMVNLDKPLIRAFFKGSQNLEVPITIVQDTLI